MRTVADRFWAKVGKEGPLWNGSCCWLWIGARGGGGYGRFLLNHKLRAAHRVAYELLAGPIPEGLALDHLCQRPLCVNPGHLEPVTNGENGRRAYTSGAVRAGRMRTFQEYLDARLAASLPRWRYVLHLAETMSGPEIAKALGVTRQRVYQIVKKANEAQGR